MRITNSCTLCSEQLRKVISLGYSPIANQLFDTKPEPAVYPLTLMQCDGCAHLQLDYSINPSKLFVNYPFVSDTGTSNRRHFEQYANEMLMRFDKPFVIDIGSNDGLFLSFFKKSGCKVIGFEPSENIAKLATSRNDVFTINNFFNEQCADAIIKSDGKADLITCNNCFAHNADLTPIVKGVKSLLKEDGVFAVEVSYAMDLLKSNLFDLIYHEHFHHWDLTSMDRFLRKHGLMIFDAQRVNTHGGSIRIFIAHKNGNRKRTAHYLTLCEQEEANFMNLVYQFKKEVPKLKEQVKKELDKLKGKTISVYGHPAKAATLLSYFEMHDQITDVFDDNELKVGKLTANGKEILPTKDIYTKKPDYLFICSWNYAGDIMKQHSDFPGKFIIPLPIFRIY